MPAQKEQRPPADRERARDDDADAAESGAADVRLTHAEQEALRRRLREKFH
ncbi:hypothetical protein WEI85_35695 [Actinomycetes bacterium KLBMP 9797]